MEGTPESMSWWEPRWSWMTALRPLLAGMGLLSAGMWIRITVVGVAAAAAGLYILHRAAPQTPFPPGLVRATLVGALALPVMMGVNLAALICAPGLVNVSPRGLKWSRSSSHLIEAHRIVWANVRPAGPDRYVLAIEYQDRRDRSVRRDFGLSRKVDPDALAEYLITLGWPMPPEEDE